MLYAAVLFTIFHGIMMEHSSILDVETDCRRSVLHVRHLAEFRQHAGVRRTVRILAICPSTGRNVILLRKNYTDAEKEIPHYTSYCQSIDNQSG